MMNEEDKLHDTIPNILANSNRHTTSLDFKTNLMRRIEMIYELKLDRKRYMKKVAIFISISIVLALCLTFILSGLNNMLVSQSAQFREIVQIFLVSTMLMLGGLILYLGNAFLENRNRNLT